MDTEKESELPELTDEMMDVFRQEAQQDLLSYSIFMNKDYQTLPFHRTIADKLQEVKSGKCKRLMVFMPPRSWKSQLASINFPAWVLWNDPSKKVVVASYGQDLANLFSRQTMQDTQSEYYTQLFNLQLTSESVQHRETQEKWYYHAVWVWWPLVGFWFDIGIIDDPVKDRKEAESMVERANVWNWYTSVFWTRMMNDQSAIIIMTTRRHIDDLAGRLIKQEEAGWQKRDKIVIPALDEKWEAIREKRFSTQYLLDKKNEIGIRDFSALYMQDPIASTGSIFKPSDFKYFLMSDFEKVWWLNKKDFVLACFIDPAFSTSKTSDDAVVIIAWREKNQNACYIFDIYADTSAPSRTIDSVFNLIDRREMLGFRVEFISLEKNTLNRDQTQFKVTLQQEMSNRNKYYTIYDYMPREKKEDRIKFYLEPIVSNQRFYMIKWHGDYNAFHKLEEQMTMFPSIDHDDVIDCATQMVTVFKNRGSWQNPNTKTQQRSYFDKITGKLVYI